MQRDLYGVFKPETQTVRDIFDGNRYYHVPDYQRPYSWEDEQIDDLWEDIYSAFENGVDGYFLGPVILVRRSSGDLEVVDGQQRLTTLMILFCVLRDLHLARDKRVLNAIKSLVDEKYRLRLITQQYYQNRFEQDILAKVAFPDGPLTKDQKKTDRLLNAATNFRKRLAAMNEAEISKFVDYVLDKVIMITIVCSDFSFAIRLFQTLNTRGLELNGADLVKSYLYGRLEPEKRGQFISTWNEIETLADSVEERLTDLLTYYEYYLLASNPERTLYEELESVFKNKNPNDVVWEFRKFVKVLCEIENDDSKLITSFCYLPNQVFWKSVLASARLEKFPDFERLCRELRKLYYSYWISDYTTSKVKQLSFNMIKAIKEKKTIDEVESLVNRKIRDDRVPARMIEALNEDCYEQKWLKPLLILVEYEQTDDSNVTYIEMNRKLHVDHVLPQKWTKIDYWKRKWNDEQRAAYWLNKMGNLTLLSGKKNIEASNDSFSNKKAIYQGKGVDGVTAFLTTQQVMEEADWTEIEVRKRHDWVTGQVKRILNVVS